MTEAEWLASDDSVPMLASLCGKASDRKLRLFTVACSQRVWRLLSDERSRASVALGERLADDPSARAERRAAALSANEVAGPTPLARAASVAASFAVDSNMLRGEGQSNAPARRCAEEASQAAAYAAFPSANSYELTLSASRAPEWSHAHSAERKAQANIVRDIFGPLPFRPLIAELNWKTSTVADLAQAIYSGRAFDRLPILADALEDAGCTNRDILDHCRQPGEHVRGCWVVDLVLGKQ